MFPLFLTTGTSTILALLAMILPAGTLVALIWTMKTLHSVNKNVEAIARKLNKDERDES